MDMALGAEKGYTIADILQVSDSGSQGVLDCEPIEEDCHSV